MQAQLTADQISKLLAGMRLVLFELTVGLQHYKHGLHLILLGGGHDPLSAVACLVDLFKVFIL